MKTIFVLAILAAGPASALAAVSTRTAAVADLIQAWEDEGSPRDVQRDAAVSLGKAGIDGAVIIPSLIMALTGEDLFRQDSAALALAEFGPLAQYAVPALKSAALKKNSRRLHFLSAKALGRIGAPAIGALVEILGAKHLESKEAAYKALGDIGPPAVPALLEALSNKKRREFAIAALNRMEQRPLAAIAPLIAILEKRKSKERGVAAAALGNYGVDASSATPALTAALGAKKYEVRVAAAFALFQIEPANPNCVRALIRIRKVKRDYSFFQAEQLLMKLGPQDLEAIPVLEIALKDKDETIRILAEKVLKNIRGGD